jgi:hypothetical protein
MIDRIQKATEELIFISRWLDDANGDRHPEAVTWGRLAKIAEEGGEVIEAFIGATGQNPRKGETHSLGDVRKELLDVAITALGAYEHLDDHSGNAVDALLKAISSVSARAALAELKSRRALAESLREPVQMELDLTGAQAAIDDHHTRLHGFCIHGELRGECTKGNY